MDRLTAHTMGRYNRWMNQRLYECCSRLSDDERKKDVGAFFKSIHGTLNHILLGDRVWMGRFTGNPFTPASLSQELYSDFAELRTEREATDAAILDWAGSLKEEDFTREFSYTSVVNPQTRRYPFSVVVAHLFNHQTHHRGQLTTLLFQRGIDPGVTDLIWLPELQGGASS
jgi:uncharacterized damage-inducible protein DinB